ncbi:hypothetical protein Tco_1197573 [Tanacetum coccineum]
MSKSLSASRNEPKLMLNQLELGATCTIVGYLMHCTARGNIAHNFLLLKEGAIYSVTNFLVQTNKEDFRVMRFADFMLEFDGDTRVQKSFVKSEGFNRYPFQFVEIDDLKPTNNKYLIGENSNIIVQHVT